MSLVSMYNEKKYRHVLNKKAQCKFHVHTKFEYKIRLSPGLYVNNKCWESFYNLEDNLKESLTNI